MKSSSMYRIVIGFLLVMQTAFCLAQMMPKPPANTPVPPSSVEDLRSSKMLAKYFTAQPNFILETLDKGLQVIDLEKRTVLAKALPEQKVVSIAVFPDNRNQAMVSTGDGNVYRIDFENNSLVTTRIDKLSEGTIGAVQDILINTARPDYVAATDSKSIFISSDRGTSWNIEKPLVIEKQEHHLIRALLTDPFFSEFFLVSTLGSGRYQIAWETGQITEYPEEAIPHGYVVTKNGKSFIPIGQNSQIFGLKHFDIQIEDLIIDSQNKNVIYMAGLGKSPVKCTVEDNRMNVDYLNPRILVSFTIDIDPFNGMNMIVASAHGLSVSKDGGKNWEKIE